ncbi:aldo/keto reductase [Novosphingobium piscinae]|nr:aldo/keto reductase [Novosphingobium piscinae]
MPIRLVGRSGLRSSAIALGTMTFGEAKAWGTTADEAEAIMAAYVERGGTTIDTAPNYAGGTSEEIVGRFAHGRRDELVLSTKYTASALAHPLAGGNSRRSMVGSVEASLTRLGTDRIDLLWLHFWDCTTPLDEILRAADDLCRAGKILYFGLSDTPAWVASRAVTMAELTRIVPVAALQMEYSVAVRDVEHELLPLAAACDLGVFCWGPLAAGALARGESPQRRKVSSIPAQITQVATRLGELADREQISARALALSWLTHSTRASCFPIIGARTAGQLIATLDDLVSPPSADALAACDAIAPPAALFPERLIQSSYLRRLALGAPDRFVSPLFPRN